MNVKVFITIILTALCTLCASAIIIPSYVIQPNLLHKAMISSFKNEMWSANGRGDIKKVKRLRAELKEYDRKWHNEFFWLAGHEKE